MILSLLIGAGTYLIFKSLLAAIITTFGIFIATRVLDYILARQIELETERMFGESAKSFQNLGVDYSHFFKKSD